MKISFSSFNKPLFFSWILVILTLSLILGSGLYSDDIQDFQMRRSMGQISFSQVLRLTYMDVDQWSKSGRCIPFTFFLAGFLFWISNTILVYKLCIFVINLWAVYSFTRLLRNFGLHGWIPLALVVFCATAQFYINYHDSFTSLHAMFPMLAVFIFSSTSAFISFLKKGGAWRYMLSFLLMVLAIMDSEVGFLMYPVVLILLLADQRKFTEKALLFLPFFVFLIAYAYGFALIRQNIQHLYSGVETNFQVSKMARVVVLQVMAAIPLTGFIHMIAIPALLLKEFMKIYPLVLCALAAFSGLLISSRPDVYSQIDRKTRILLFGMGLILLLMPAFILMISKRYQEELYPGRGYLPVYIQNFGFILLVLLVFGFIFSKFPERKVMIRNAGFIVFFVISILAILRNGYYINNCNEERSIPSAFYYQSLKNGIMSGCEDGSIIVLRTDYYGRAPFFYQVLVDNFYKNRFQVISEQDFGGIKVGEERHFYMLEHNATEQYTLLYRLSPTGKTIIKRINYPVGKEFSYFDLISMPL